MSTAVKRPAYLVRVGLAHKRLVLCVLLGVLIAAVVPLAPVTRALVGWDVGVLAYLIAAAVVMARCRSSAQMKQNAAAQDEGALAILILTAGAAMASLGAIFAELVAIDRNSPAYGAYVALTVVTVLLSWAFTHTIFALHYAHEFYGGHSRAEGLRFPGGGEPDYWDFVYFAFVIGMTFQVSDVAITKKPIRRLVVAHGALSFFFTTAILALTVNIAASLIQR
jgi:uncharacterized membrane protein